MKKLLLSLGGGLAVFVFSVSFAFAATTHSLVGDSAIVAGGNPGNAAQIRSDATIAPSYGGVSVVPGSPIPWASLVTVSTDFNVTDDNCGGGSPRVQIRVDTNNDGISDGSVRVALGPSPNFTGCSAGWQSAGNLIGNADAGRYDYSVFGGSPFTTYTNAPAVVTAGQVVGVFVVVDGSWSAAATGGDGEQTTLVDNITVNSDVTTFDPVLVGPPTNKDECKKDGWQTFNNPSFKNQGECVSYVAKNTLVGKATGDIWMGGDGAHQQMNFNAFDYGSNSSQDKGQVEYWNYDYPGPLHYTTNVMCSTVFGNETRFMFQIPAGWPGLTGLYVVSYVKDGGTPGTNGDLYGHNATSSLTTAKQWCETGSGFSPAMYPITDGNLVVHN